MSKHLEIKDYPEKEMIEIEGIKYSYEFFLGLGCTFRLNTPFIITQRKDGVITAKNSKEKP